MTKRKRKARFRALFVRILYERFAASVNEYQSLRKQKAAIAAEMVYRRKMADVIQAEIMRLTARERG